MEYNLMSASFASICEKTFDEAENGEKQKSFSSEATRLNDKKKYVSSDSGAAGQTSFFAPSAHESFTSIVNAESCANAKGEEILKSYLTLARQATFLRSYMY